MHPELFEPTNKIPSRILVVECHPELGISKI